MLGGSGSLIPKYGEEVAALLERYEIRLGFENHPDEFQIELTREFPLAEFLLRRDSVEECGNG